MDILRTYSLQALPNKTFKLPKKKQKIVESETIENGISNYVCYNCNKHISIDQKSKIICPDCLCRVLIKKTEMKYIKYNCV